MPNLKQILKNIEKYLRSNNFRTRLRKGQKSIFRALFNFLNDGNKAGYFKLPSGVGKTNIAIELVRAGGFKKVLFLVPTLTLVNQTVKRFHKFHPEVSVDVFHGSRKEMGKTITVATYQSFQRRTNFPVDLNEFDLVIWDEAHLALSEGRQKIMSLFDDETIHLGLTASDKYDEVKGVSNLMPCIAEMEIEEAIKLGLLCSVQCWLARSGIDIGNISFTNQNDYDLRHQKRVLDVDRRNNLAKDIYINYLNGQTCLITCINIEHAIRVAEIFKNAGVKAEAVWGSTTKYYLPKAELHKRLDDFKTGKLQIVTTVNLIDTGFDNTLISALINLRITGSLVKATQRAGRTLRLFNNGDSELPIPQQMIKLFGGKLSTVIDLLDEYGNHGFRPVLFSDILQNAIVLSPGMAEVQPSNSPTKDHFLWPSGTGINDPRVITDLTLVAQITNEMTTFENLPVADSNGVVFLPTG
jgi:superfamily II DNA or RNA helicase